MKHLNKAVSAVAMAAVLAMPQAAKAHREITEADKAEIVLANGKTQQGYIWDYWFNAASLGQQNYKFKFVRTATADKDDAYDYTCADVRRITLVNPPEGMPCVWQAVTLAQYDTEQLMNLLQQRKSQFMGVSKRGNHATLLTCQVLVQSPLNEFEAVPATLWALRLDGDADAYPVVIDGKVDLAAFNHHLKGRRPQLVKWMKRYFKSGSRRKAAAKNPAAFLDIYDQFLSENPDE